MPMKPENRNRYPHDWEQIKSNVLIRAGYACEHCGAKSGDRVARGDEEYIDTYMTSDSHLHSALERKDMGLFPMDDYPVKNMVDIVLTVTPLQHIPESASFENSKALCQRCLFRHHADYFHVLSRITRKKRKAIGDLFDDFLQHH